jgi:hypothetical protein
MKKLSNRLSIYSHIDGKFYFMWRLSSITTYRIDGYMLCDHPMVCNINVQLGIMIRIMKDIDNHFDEISIFLQKEVKNAK